MCATKLDRRTSDENEADVAEGRGLAVDDYHVEGARSATVAVDTTNGAVRLTRAPRKTAG